MKASKHDVWLGQILLHEQGLLIDGKKSRPMNGRLLYFIIDLYVRGCARVKINSEDIMRGPTITARAAVVKGTDHHHRSSKRWKKRLGSLSTVRKQ